MILAVDPVREPQHSTKIRKEHSKVTSAREHAKSKYNVTVVHVLSKNGTPPTNSDVASLDTALRHETLKNIFDPDQIRHVNMDSVQDLIRQQVPDKSPLKDATRDADVIFGIIDSKGWSKEQVERIEAELHRFGERRLGAVTICLKKRSLIGLLETKTPEHNMNPFRKINFMLGNVNFNTISPFHDIKKLEQIMYVGAHLSHPESRATEYTPSVASVVASLRSEPILYPGSARLQTTVREIHGGKIIVEDQIQELEAMIVERFQAWRDENGSDTHPLAVVFYRD